MTRQVERLLKRLPVSWIFAWMYNGLMPHDRLMKTIELFGPRFCRGWRMPAKGQMLIRKVVPERK